MIPSPIKIKGIQPHSINQNVLTFSKGNIVYKAEVQNIKKAEAIGKYDAGIWKNFLSFFDLPKRIGRLGFHKIKPYKGGLIGIQHQAIIYKPKGDKNFKSVFSNFRGSRPLDLFVHPNEDEIIFGEYFANTERDEVYIYKSKDLITWEKAWVFKKGEIRHVHGLVWDTYRNGIWVLTGDLDNESALYFTDNNFETLSRVVEGNQKCRAVEIIPAPNGLIIPMDSPMEKNYINFYNIDKNTFRCLAQLPGSAFHATCINGLYLISTVTEPSKINKTNYATLWGSINGEFWKELYQFKKDFIPKKWQFISRYAEIFFPSGVNSTNYIIAYAHAIKNYSGALLLWETKYIKEYLNS